jgi:hypothetical protein
VTNARIESLSAKEWEIIIFLSPSVYFHHDTVLITLLSDSNIEKVHNEGAE